MMKNFGNYTLETGKSALVYRAMGTTTKNLCFYQHIKQFWGKCITPKNYLNLLFIASVLIAAPSFANPKFVVESRILYYNTELAPKEDEQEITFDDLEVFDKVLKGNPDIKVVYLTSWGGDVETSYEIADLIIDYGLDTHVVDICFSGCTTLLLSGKKRTLEKGSKVGFHRSWWDVDLMKDYYEENKEYQEWGSVFEFAAWVHEDAQEEIYKDFEFLLERGVDPLFAIKTLKAEADDDWYPRRKELLDANFLTE